jgi:hypothetical protein
LPANPDLRIIDFVNVVRVVRGHPARPGIYLVGTDVDDPEGSVVATAMECQVDESLADDWSGAWVMRFESSRVAQLVARCVDVPSRSEHSEVLLPNELVDLSVSEHRGLVEADADGLVAGWWVPVDDNDAVLAWCTTGDFIDRRFPVERITDGLDGKV